ncbi:MAG: methionine--tRNA ligase [Symbiobacteriaceae bacterium]|nr:methionine--tRNA ligase [Symbiobacteriaceae bacterium]
MSQGKFYLTTPIYYASGKPHIGHAYTTIVADALARFHRLVGYKVHFLTGVDEHGSKVVEKATEAGVSPQEYVDSLDPHFRSLWQTLDITHDDYIRTTEERHTTQVQVIFQRLYDQGDIYKRNYEGHYCVPCEAFWTERQLQEGNLCPDCGRPVTWVTEESYYFRASKYAERLLAHIRENPEFIQPATRANEMVNNFLLPGLEDLCVSRSGLKWGVPVPFDPEHVIYVWIDALSNYITALNYATTDNALYTTFWPADLHLVGKEITRFHCLIWPIILMALDVPLPRTVLGHGWLLFDEEKMSKSKGNVVDPNDIVAEYGSDPLRYYLLAKVQLGHDANFSNELFNLVFNVDLANDFGNLLSRTVAMIENFCGGTVGPLGELEPLDLELKTVLEGLPARVREAIEKLDPATALGEIWKVVGHCNKYIDSSAPWALNRQGKKERVATVLYLVGESLRYIAVLLQPFLPQTAPRLFQQLGLGDKPELMTWLSVQSFGQLPPGTIVRKGEALFPRKVVRAEDTKQEDKVVNQNQASDSSPMPEFKPQITIEDFAKLDLRIAKVIACEKVPKADRLLQMTLEVGNTTRTIISGIAEHYSSEELVGKLICIVANLEPAKIRGIASHGMLLAASDDAHTQVILLEPGKPLPTGLRVK